MAMARRKGKDEQRFASGGVTNVQVAFLVERYLKDNSYSKALSGFRAEAAAVLAPFKSEVPVSMMSLTDILNDYILLKERSLAVQQQKTKLDQLFGSLRDMLSDYQAADFNVEGPLLRTPPKTTEPPVAAQARVTAQAPVAAQAAPAAAQAAPVAVQATPVAVQATPVAAQAAPVAAAQSTKSFDKRRFPEEAPIIDITNTASRTKRMRHINPEDDPVLRGLNPNTPPEKQQRPATAGGAFSTSASHCAQASPSVRAPSNNTPALEPPKVRSKRRQSVPRASKCKSLDFSSTQPAIASDFSGGKAHAVQSLNFSQHQVEQQLPVELQSVDIILSDDFFDPQLLHQLPSLDEILATSLDGTGFTDFMNTMLDNEFGTPLASSSIVLDNDVGSHQSAARRLDVDRTTSRKENTPPAKNRL